jgi:hypothetical protein
MCNHYYFAASNHRLEEQMTGTYTAMQGEKIGVKNTAAANLFLSTFKLQYFHTTIISLARNKFCRFKKGALSVPGPKGLHRREVHSFLFVPEYIVCISCPSLDPRDEACL